MTATLEELRTPSASQIYHQPLRYPEMSDHIYCPVCGCEKSGDINEPNNVYEWCDDHDCRCHQDGMAPTDETSSHPDHDHLRARHLDNWTCDDCGLADGQHDLSVEH